MERCAYNPEVIDALPVRLRVTIPDVDSRLKLLSTVAKSAPHALASSAAVVDPQSRSCEASTLSFADSGCVWDHSLFLLSTSTTTSAMLEPTTTSRRARHVREPPT